MPWAFPPFWGLADNTKEQQKRWGTHSVPPAMTRDPAEFGRGEKWSMLLFALDMILVTKTLKRAESVRRGSKIH